ncbi:unnamed protein product [Adineta steineri]|uniref:mRNA-capping enzyme n=1 Tax=Adineta steineri TaxID=433720 RepID=A0A815T0Y1_9BILA|nr:unnamed protein product [Adineta steineri]CAF1643404.1 unnamed protein product [Adineta steineri]
MSSFFSFSSGTAIQDEEGIIPKWLDCPEKSTIINEKFVAFKMPIEDQNIEDIPEGKQWSWDTLIEDIKKDDNQELGLVIDLTGTNPYYNNDKEFIRENIRYEKIPWPGDNEIPTDYQIQLFINTCYDFIRSKPDKIIGVHCTYGFDRTGFFICAYLCQQLRISIAKAINLFAIARSPGICNQIYLEKLIQLYGNENIEPNLAPPLPTWCSTAGLPESTINERPHDDTNSEQGTEQTQHEIHTTSSPKFAVDLANVILIDSESADRIRLICQEMCKWDRQTFPGSRPVSMDRENCNIVSQSYQVSWKAMGTRYMLLILNKSEIYMIDRNNVVFKINYLWFPQDPNCTNHLENTLLDGVFVTNKTGNVEEYLYYVYDVVYYNSEDVSQKSFIKRMEIYKNIINIRNEAVRTSYMDNRSEPFSIHAKKFWDLPAALKLLGDKFQSQLRHVSNGLIFQPVNDPYMPGEFWRVLKWEKDDTNANAETTTDSVMNAIKRPISKSLLCSVIREHILFENYISELN